VEEHENTAHPELVTCPDCDCQVSPRRLEDHRLHRCRRHKVKLRHLRRRPEAKLITRNRVYAMPQYEPPSRCKFCGRAAVPGSTTCYSCMS